VELEFEFDDGHCAGGSDGVVAGATGGIGEVVGEPTREVGGRHEAQDDQEEGGLVEARGRGVDDGEGREGLVEGKIRAVVAGREAFYAKSLVFPISPLQLYEVACEAGRAGVNGYCGYPKGRVHIADTRHNRQGFVGSEEDVGRGEDGCAFGYGFDVQGAGQGDRVVGEANKEAIVRPDALRTEPVLSPFQVVGVGSDCFVSRDGVLCSHTQVFEHNQKLGDDNRLRRFLYIMSGWEGLWYGSRRWDRCGGCGAHKGFC